MNLQALAPPSYSVAMLAVFLTALPALETQGAEPEAEFYRGKTLTFIIGSGPGASYDLAGRLLAQHLQRRVPGQPTIVPRNMPGASSVVAMEYLYNVAPRDGTAMGFVQPTVLLHKLTTPAAKFEPAQLNWLGRMASVVTVGVVWGNAPARSIEEAKSREVILGAAAPSGLTATVPWALNRLIGTRFRVILGYESMAKGVLAMERGEVQGVGSLVWDYFPHAKPEWVSNRQVIPIYAIGLSRHPKLPDVPTIVELAGNDIDRNVMKLLGGAMSVGFAVSMPPQVPPTRLAVLRSAFEAVVADADFIAEAGKREIAVEPMSGPELDKLVAGLAGMQKIVVERMNEVTRQP